MTDTICVSHVAMDTFDAIFDAFGGTSAVARALGVGQSTASEMKRRGAIPSEYWPRLVAAADASSITGVSYEALAIMQARIKGKLPDDLGVGGQAA